MCVCIYIYIYIYTHTYLLNIGAPSSVTQAPRPPQVPVTAHCRECLVGALSILRLGPP